MHTVQKQFQSFLNAYHNDGDRILVAVSGGVDSMVLAHLFKRSGIPFEVAHCNYQLRGEDSDLDEKLVKEWCERVEVNCHSKRFELEKSKSIQIEARNVRYRWFAELTKQQVLDRLATAHQLNDSLETHLINLCRGSGLKGFTGVPSHTQDLLRPLSNVTREEIVDFAIRNHIEWREDASNSKNDYQRNFIRNEIVPRLNELNPALLQTYQSTLERLQYSGKVIQKKVDEIAQSVEHLEGYSILAMDWCKDESDQVILSELISVYGFNYPTAKEIFKARDMPGKVFLAEDWKIITDRKRLFISGLEKKQRSDVEISGVGVFENAHNRVEVNLTSKPIFNENKHSELFDVDKLIFPLTLRKWKSGDRFKPLGMKGTKLVSDFLIDVKVPMTEKENVLILESGQEIAWVVGYRISNDFKVKKSTLKAFEINIKNKAQ